MQCAKNLSFSGIFPIFGPLTKANREGWSLKTIGGFSKGFRRIKLNFDSFLGKCIEHPGLKSSLRIPSELQPFEMVRVANSCPSDDARGYINHQGFPWQRCFREDDKPECILNTLKKGTSRNILCQACVAGVIAESYGRLLRERLDYALKRLIDIISPLCLNK